MSNGTVLPQVLFRVSTWWRAMKWTALLTAAIFVAAIAVSDGEFAGDIGERDSQLAGRAAPR